MAKEITSNFIAGLYRTLQKRAAPMVWGGFRRVPRDATYSSAFCASCAFVLVFSSESCLAGGGAETPLCFIASSTTRSSGSSRIVDSSSSSNRVNYTTKLKLFHN